MQKNRIELAGYLAAAVEVRHLPSGTKVANSRLGESYRYRDAAGKTQTHTNWHNVTFYDNLADLAVTFHQGENLFLEGTLQQRKFTPKDGVTRTVHEVVVRSCHVIAPSSRATDPRCEGVAVTEAIEGDLNHDETWPV